MGVPLPHPDGARALPRRLSEPLGVSTVTQEVVGPALRVLAGVPGLLDDDDAVLVWAPAQEDAAGLPAVRGCPGEPLDPLSEPPA